MRERKREREEIVAAEHRALWVSVVFLISSLLSPLSLAGCGYVRVRVTASPPTPTATAQVQLVTPSLRATSTPVPSTPLPTATPTATPTPVIHVIRKGDNLLALAYHYDVDVQALIAVNDIDNPRALRIGQRLIIPREEGMSPDKQATPTPTPMPLQVVNLAFHHTPAGSLWSLGEVQNEQDESLELAQLAITLYNADGERVAEATGFTVTDIVPDHGRAPFALLFANLPSSGFASYEVVVLGAEPIVHWGRRHRALDVQQITWTEQGGALQVEGVLHNGGQADANEVEVTVTAYGENGQVVGVRGAQVEPLAAGERREFSVTLIPAARPARIKAVAWGIKSPESPAAASEKAP